MSVFERKLARFREAQERKRSKGMSKHKRKEVVDRLTQQIEVTTDPKTLIELSRQVAKLLPKPKARRVSRNAVRVPKGNMPEGIRFLTA